ncbi:hypothetical protein DM860_010599 [Cuscuta australis]|uniref:Endonuclease/exonuclease/phosphatase domain-containing protein n=1 Tax=Cuscuta australis TaxID=267555 RepID=A0A328E606_9ASTE|nr:hypothetical protein DM860_010599 [Cuscuta australis]
MRETEGLEQRRESCGETRKRNHIYFEGFDEERTKRQKWVSQAQTLTVNSSQFRNFRSSSSSSSRSRWNSINRNASWGSRKWVYSSGDFSNYKDRIVIVSYNILGVENAAKHPDSYLNVPQNFLSWSWRKNLIRKEIIGYKPSIICFQEVDRFDDLCDFLKKDGFKGVYMPRTGEACDGCAIFWKKKVVSLCR